MFLGEDACGLHTVPRTPHLCALRAICAQMCAGRFRGAHYITGAQIYTIRTPDVKCVLLHVY
jgi:hypothetical protein